MQVNFHVLFFSLGILILALTLMKMMMIPEVEL